MTDTTTLRALAEAAPRHRVDIFFASDSDPDEVEAAKAYLLALHPNRVLSLLDRLDALEAVADAARAYLACDGSGVKDPDPRWRAPFDAFERADALAALRAALARLEKVQR